MTRRWQGLGGLAFLVLACGESTTDADDGSAGASGSAASSGAGAEGGGGAGTAGQPGKAGASGEGGSSTSGAPGQGGVEGGAGGNLDAVRGAVSLHVVPNGNCSLGDVWLDFPETDSGHPVTATTHDVLGTDETRDEMGRRVNVNCEWLSREEPPWVALGISMQLDGDGRSFSTRPRLAQGMETTETVRFFSSLSNGPMYNASQADPCKFETIQLDMDSESVWGEVTCDIVEDDEMKESCQVVEGYFYFENCKDRELP